jgi:hypothetical protein
VKALVLAAEGLKDRDLWYPTILGVLVVIAAVSLFMGTIYLLLATNLGSRLGFLIAAAGLSGFMVLLSLLWLTTASPLTTLKGRSPSWKAVESIKGGDLARSKIPEVRALTEDDELTDSAEQANVKAALDQVVVTPELVPGEEEVAETNEFQIYEAATDYLTPTYYEVGGGNIFSQVEASLDGRFPLVHVSLHTPLYAVVNICPVDKEALVVPFGEAPPEPKCDADGEINTVVFERDLGSVRVPPFVTLIGSSILFALCLLGLHWRERDLQEQAARLQAEADAANASALERIPEKV